MEENIPQVYVTAGQNLTYLFWKPTGKLYLDSRKVDYNEQAGTVVLPENLKAGSYTLLDDNQKICQVVVVKQLITPHKPLIVQQMQGNQFLIPAGSKFSVTPLNGKTILDTITYSGNEQARNVEHKYTPSAPQPLYLSEEEKYLSNLDSAFKQNFFQLAAKKPGYILKERRTEGVVHDEQRLCKGDMKMCDDYECECANFDCC